MNNDEKERFCAECRNKTTPEQSDTTASECGHRTQLKEMKFCMACAITYTVCRRCGTYLKP